MVNTLHILLWNLGIQDKLKKFYYQTLRKRDFEFMEKGLIAGKENELLIAG